MSGKITKSVPNPGNPAEVIRHYYEHLVKWLVIYYRDTRFDFFGNKRAKRFKNLLSYKGAGDDKIAFVLAGGPSINTLDPLKLRAYCDQHGGEIFCVNYFINSDFAKLAGIDNWVISDPLSFDFTQKINQEALKNVNAGICKRIFSAEQYTKFLDGKTQKEFIPFNDIETSNIFSSNINPCYPRSFVSMTAYKALSIAIFMGFDTIYICGFDNTYIQDLRCDQNNKLYRKLVHFDSKPEDKNNGIDPDTIIRLRERTVAEELLAYSRLFSDLNRFKKYPIKNLDPNSLTDAFQKVRSLDIFK
jgi:hypothetical protein